MKNKFEVVFKAKAGLLFNDADSDGEMARYRLEQYLLDTGWNAKVTLF